VFQQLG
nr:Chain C, FliM::FliN fragment [Salmonella enterica subsp. enterica serovar Typhimurium]